jgi:hypothetical protein
MHFKERMQRFAFLKNGDRIEATEGIHRLDYTCPECHGIVRVRRGEKRAPHFFHKNEGTSCHLRLKDGLHQAVQSWLLNTLGQSSCSRECHFPAISRVADIAYHPQKVVFEIQVSPIDPEEAMRRTLDYWGIGWHVIWLLHAATYGKSLASSFEKILLPIPHYFTDIGYREGTIWDELSAVRGRTRFWYSFPPRRQLIDDLSIEIVCPPQQDFPTTGFPQTVHQWMQMRSQSWSCRFRNDILSSEIVECTDSKKTLDWMRLRDRWRVKCYLLWLRCIR